MGNRDDWRPLGAARDPADHCHGQLVTLLCAGEDQVKARRKKISDRTKLAATLCQMLRPNEAGELVPIIDYESAKKMTEDQICSVFHFDHHPIAKHLGGEDKHYNLVPRPILEHRAKTAKVDIPAAAKSARLSEEQEAFRNKMLAKAGQGWAYEPKQKIGAVIPGSKRSRFKKHLNGKVTLR